MAQQNDVAIEFRGVSYRIETGSTLLDELDLQVRRGETLVLLGRSGSGKTTTLKLINRLLAPTRGQVLVEGSRRLGSFTLNECRRELHRGFWRAAAKLPPWKRPRNHENDSPIYLVVGGRLAVPLMPRAGQALPLRALIAEY